MNKCYAINDSDFKNYDIKRVVEGVVDFAFYDEEYDYNSMNDNEGELHCKFMLKNDMSLKPFKKLFKGSVSSGDYVGFVLKPYSGLVSYEDFNRVAFLKKYDKKTGEVLETIKSD